MSHLTPKPLDPIIVKWNRAMTVFWAVLLVVSLVNGSMFSVGVSFVFLLLAGVHTLTGPTSLAVTDDPVMNQPPKRL